MWGGVPGRACMCVHVCVCVCGSAREWACVCERVALFIQHATRMRHSVSSAACLAPPHFSALSHKRQDFPKNVTEHKMCVLIFYTTFTWKIRLCRIFLQDIAINVKTTSCDTPGILTRFEFEFFRQIFFNNSSTKFHQNQSSGSRVVPCERLDRQTDRPTWRR